MNKIFLECGSHCSCSISKFYQEWPNASEYIIHSFEGNSDLIPEIKSNIKKNKWENVILHEAVVWDFDGTVNMFVMETTGGSTIVEGKIKYSKKLYKDKYSCKDIQVKCIDLSRFIKDNFNITDHIVLKMDIEGAEYEIVDKMIEDNTLKYISEIHLEWHNWRCGKDKKGVGFRVDWFPGKEVYPIDIIYMDKIKKISGLDCKYWDSFCSTLQHGLK